MKRLSVSFRLTEEAKRLLVLLSQKLGISQTSVIEQSLRLLARQQGISE